MNLLEVARKTLLAGVTAAGLFAAVPGCNDPVAPPPLKGQVHLTLIHTADIHSRLFPYDLQLGETDSGLGLGASGAIVNVGGGARVSYVVGRERARAQRVLHLDGGDSFQGAPVFNFFSGEAEIRTLSAIGTDASLVANHEFDRGALNLGIQLQKWADFPVLAANYTFEDPSLPGASPLGGIVKPFTVFDLEGLRVGVIGMGNLSSLTSIFDTPNRLGITPLNTTETAQFYVDLLRPQVDLVIVLSHLGLDVDENMIQTTSGIDLVLGGHNHIVLQPPKQVPDCSAYSEIAEDGTTKNYILLDGDSSGQSGVGCMHDADCGTDAICFGDSQSIQEGYGICKVKRYCQQRNVFLCHSGAFAKYVGRLDLLVSNDPADLTDRPYDPLDGFEILTDDYQLFPITEQTPDDPVVTSVLEPYSQALDAVGNLDLLVGYALQGSDRSAAGGGDSPLGNLISTAMWLRLGIQTDFAITNTTGIRTDLVPGPVTVEEMYNIFPFDNTITKMELSGVEVQEMFDFVARRSESRGCVSQVQIAGARLVIDCTTVGPVNESMGDPGIASHIYIGAFYPPIFCKSDDDCPGKLPNQCDLVGGVCWQPIDQFATYELATSNYLAAGGSGFTTLKHNTTQNNTGVEQRDALIDYIRAGFPCGADANGKLTACSVDGDCATQALGDGYVCACPETVEDEIVQCVTDPTKSCMGKGQCVLGQCRDDVAAFQRTTCQAAPTSTIQAQCENAISPCAAGGETCKYLACVNKALGNYPDGRIQMVGQ
jgi:5'-nucleotidase / UDP-sugar diphosphatase